MTKVPSYEESGIRPPGFLPSARPLNTRKAQAEFLEDQSTWGYNYSANVRLRNFFWGKGEFPFEETAYAELEYSGWHEFSFMELESDFHKRTGYHIDFAGRSNGQLILTDSSHNTNREPIAESGSDLDLTDVLFADIRAWKRGLKDAGNKAQADAVTEWMKINTDNHWLQDRLEFYRNLLIQDPLVPPIVLYGDMDRVSVDLRRTVGLMQTEAEKADYKGRQTYRFDNKKPDHQSYYLTWRRENLREEVDLVWDFYSTVEEMALSFAYHVWDRVNEGSNDDSV